MIEEPNGIDAHVGSRVRDGRRMRGMTPSELAGRIGLTRGQLQEYETGAHRISATVLAAISRALNLPAAYFFRGLTEVIGPCEVDEVAGPTPQRMPEPTLLAGLPVLPQLAGEVFERSILTRLLVLVANDDAPDGNSPDA